MAISWKTLEFEHKEKNRDWYTAVGIIGGSIVVASFLLGNFIFAIFAALALFSLILYSFKKPGEVSVEISDGGIIVQSTLFPYTNIEGFWVDETRQQKRILLKSKRLFSPLIILPIAPEIKIDYLKNFLSQKINEEHLEESIFEVIFERLGF